MKDRQAQAGTVRQAQTQQHGHRHSNIGTGTARQAQAQQAHRSPTRNQACTEAARHANTTCSHCTVCLNLRPPLAATLHAIPGHLRYPVPDGASGILEHQLGSHRSRHREAEPRRRQSNQRRPGGMRQWLVRSSRWTIPTSAAAASSPGSWLTAPFAPHRTVSAHLVGWLFSRRVWWFCTSSHKRARQGNLLEQSCSSQHEQLAARSDQALAAPTRPHLHSALWHHRPWQLAELAPQRPGDADDDSGSRAA